MIAPMIPVLLEMIEMPDGSIQIWKCGFLVGTYVDRDVAEMMLEMHADYMRAATEGPR
jgi:hypothetical protein